MQAIESTSTIPIENPDVARVGLHPVPAPSVGSVSDNLPAIMPGQAIDFSHLSEDTSITLKSGHREYRLTARDLIRWKCPTAPVSEAVKLLVIAQNTGLDPMLDEIELINFGGKWSVSIRKNGYVRCARNSKDYDGHESGLVIQPMDRSRPPQDVAGTVTPQGWIIVGGWAKFYSKSVSRPVYKRVALEDYDRKIGTWKANPAVMIEKVGIAQACREAFSIGETYDEAEMPIQREATVHVEPERQITGTLPKVEPAPPSGVNSDRVVIVNGVDCTASPASVVPVIPDFNVIDVELDKEQPFPPITDAQCDAIYRLTASADMGDPQFAKMLAKRGVSRVEDLTGVQAIEIIGNLSAIVDRKNLNPNA